MCAGSYKGKNDITVNVIGWAMQMAGYIFLDRKWEVDKVIITRSIKLFKEINFKPQVSMLFSNSRRVVKEESLVIILGLFF